MVDDGVTVCVGVTLTLGLGVGVGIYSLKLSYSDGLESPLIGSRETNAVMHLSTYDGE